MWRDKTSSTQTDIELNQKNYQSLWTALFIVLIPHIFYLPTMVSVLLIVVLITWQVLISSHGHFKITQNKWLQYTVVALGMTFIYLEYKTFFGVDAGCAALVMVLMGKAFEVRTYRDAIIQLNFALFVVASLFLYGQEIYLAVAALLGAMACFYGMYQLQSYHNRYEEVISQSVSVREMRSQAFRTVTRIIMYSAPLMVILFLFFPRLPPLWSMPEPSRQAKTGITDELSFGDIAELSQSSELAFRVVFDDFKEMPSKSQLYWRATVLENFDGQKWTQNFYTKFFPSIVTTSKNQAQLPRWYSPQVDLSLASYQMIMEPNFQSWTYALEHSIASEPLLMKGDLAIYSPYEVIQRRVFDINLLKPKPLAQTIIYDEKIRVLNLEWGSEENQNPRTYQLTQKLKQQHQHPEAYAQAVMNWIANNDFSYTLSPPLLSGHRVDDFLFRSKAGFCEHYASAYVTMMRMAGIPARIVIGYQGGQWAPDQKSWEVRQLDAHAWTEIWIENKGWVRIDPTSAIAPDRIEQGMQSFSAQNTSLFGESNNLAWQVQRYQWLTKARIWIDYANYQWQNKIVGFDRDKQNHWLKKLSIENITEQIIYLILGLASILGLIIWRLTAKQRVVRSSLEIALEKFSKKLAKKQLSRLPNEPVLTWLERIELIFPSTQLQRIKQLYRDHVYIQELEQNQLKELLDLLKKYPIEK